MLNKHGTKCWKRSKLESLYHVKPKGYKTSRSWDCVNQNVQFVLKDLVVINCNAKKIILMLNTSSLFMISMWAYDVIHKSLLGRH